MAALAVDDNGFVLGSDCGVDGAGQIEQCLAGPFGRDMPIRRLKRFVVLGHAATIPAMYVMPRLIVLDPIGLTSISVAPAT